MKLAMINQDRVLKPYYQSDENEFKKLKNNCVYFVEVKKPRHLEHHKKIFALANCTIANLPETSPLKLIDSYQLIKAIERELGMMDNEYKLDGTIERVPKSIAFESMDQLEFQEFYDKAVYIMAGLIGVSIEDLENNSIDFM